MQCNSINSRRSSKDGGRNGLVAVPGGDGGSGGMASIIDML